MPKLSRAAANEWKRIVPILMNLGILTIADGTALAIHCSAFARWQQSERQLARLRDLSSDKARKLFAISEKCMKLMKSVLVEFGLTPASRPRLASFAILPMDKHAEPNSVDPAAKYFSDPRSSNSIQ
jgi:P27 family predicted phage terminase small subunit